MATDPKPWPYEGHSVHQDHVLVDARYQRSKSRAERHEMDSEAVENCVEHEVQTEIRGEDIILLRQELNLAHERYVSLSTRLQSLSPSVLT